MPRPDRTYVHPDYAAFAAVPAMERFRALTRIADEAHDRLQRFRSALALAGTLALNLDESDEPEAAREVVVAVEKLCPWDVTQELVHSLGAYRGAKRIYVQDVGMRIVHPGDADDEESVAATTAAEDHDPEARPF